MKTTEEMIAVMRHANEGRCVETRIRNNGAWTPCSNPKWNWRDFDYRIALTKPSVDWSHLSDEVVCLLRLPGGAEVGLTKVPHFDEVKEILVISDDAHMIPLRYLASYRPGTCTWRDSLVLRPGHKIPRPDVS